MTMSRPPEGRIITFYSYKGGTGRTMALANTAWILAGQGKRVLVVDWDLESPGLHRYFHPFLTDTQLRSSPGVLDMIRGYATGTLEPQPADDPGWYLRHAQVLSHAMSVHWVFPDGAFLDFLPAGKQGPAYAEAVSTFDWPSFYDRLHGGAFLRALRDDMRSNYDYVLIDSRTGLSDTAGICTVLLPDIIVDCFTLSTQSIDGAAAIAHSIRAQRTDQPIQIFPVPMRVEDAEQIKLEAGRDYARQRFEPFLSHLDSDGMARYWGDVEIPYKPFYAYEEILAVFGDRPHQENTLLAAYGRLARAITGVAGEPRLLDDRERRRWLARFERPKQALPTDVAISYASVDRAWADWIAAQLTQTNVRVVMQEAEFAGGSGFEAELLRLLGTASRAVVLLSQAYVRLPGAQQFWDAVVEREQQSGSRFLVPIRLDNVRPPSPFADRLPTDLSDIVNERTAQEAVLSALDLPIVGSAGEMRPGAQLAPRFPRRPPPVSNLPQRNSVFIGRSVLLDQLHERLAGNVMVVVQALYGMGGVGKTQAALEYAYRFSAYYDVLWWISAEQPSQVRSGLAALAERLGLPVGENAEENIEAVLEALRQGSPYPHWLLIFDNAGNPEDLRRYLPTGAGHVLLTSRDHTWAEQGRANPLEVDVFERQESVALLRERLPGIGLDDADLVAEQLGDLPLAVEQAGAWLAATAMPVREYLDLLNTELPRILEEHPPPGYQRSAASSWLVSLQTLRARMPASAKLLELCAFFAPEPIPMWLITSGRFIDALLPYDRTLRDKIIQAHLVREVGRYALARVDAARPSIQLHRLVQGMIRSILPDEEAANNQRTVQEILAAANPGEPNEARTWPVYRDLLPHLTACGALDSTDPDVRQLILDMSRYLYKISDYTSSQDLAEQALTRWAATPAAEGTDYTQPEVMRWHLANSLRSQAKFERAKEIDESAYRSLANLLGDDHPHAIMLSSSLAADERALGHYDEALRLQNETHERASRVLGDDHERTLLAANNVAVSLRLMGRFREARSVDEGTYEKRQQLTTINRTYTLLSANNLALDLRELGEFEASRELLESTLAEYRVILGDQSTETLRTAKALAITLRKLGRIEEAFELTEATLRRLTELLGARHPETLACASNHACDYSARGDDERALELAEQTRSRYRETLGDNHPFTLACANNISIFLRKLGRPADALTVSTSVVGHLEAVLWPTHPYTLACTVNLSNAYFDTGEIEAAWEIDQRTYEQIKTVLGEEHPDTLAVANNLAASLDAVGRAAEARTLADFVRARSAATLGSEHPNTVAARLGARLNCDIDPPSP
ncbi:FxSxx-COOH system tetratricopeptide repeat protein [Hamadaea tsunoensis]|uniref:FxSxx-COOH system tetratricopeptide repeat protein n=1 Tax=Hamadaea tsunoensis TaxID=53368 RepID=UPI000413094E|nr:FxSxx-COOH system tetratricopeptide repeat protein [Hamadaea tsunoensis]